MTYRRSAFLLAVPLLALAACGDKDTAGEGGAPTAAPVAAVAAPAGKMWSEVVAPTPEGGMRMGNPNAPIKLVEYGSLSCPHCAKLARDGMQALIDKYVNSGRVSYEFRSFPIHGIIDVPMTVILRCASPDAYFGLVEQIYQDQDNWLARAEQGNAQAQAATNLPPNQRMAALADAFGLTDWFAARGISIDQQRACLGNAAAAEKVATEGQQWATEGVNSTPTLVINGRKLENTATWGPSNGDPGLEAALQNAGAR
jgi:protein-disulfide isomerase